MEETDIKASIKSIEDCISVLQGDLHQPGTPAIVLKLAASWQKLCPFLTNLAHRAPAEDQKQETVGSGALLEAVSQENGCSTDTRAPLAVAGDNMEGHVNTEESQVGALSVSQPLAGSESDSGLVKQEIASETSEVQCSGLLIIESHLSWPFTSNFSLSLSLIILNSSN